MLLNPNCSELVLRLPDDYTKEQVIEMLKDLGIYYIEIPSNDIYEWDNSGDKMSVIFDKDNPNMPDYENGATIHIYGDGEDNGYGDDGIRIDGHQHCQHQLFPTLKKIQDELSGEVYGQDGGSANEYEEWVHNGCKPIKDYQSKKSKKKRDSLLKRPDVNIK